MQIAKTIRCIVAGLTILCFSHVAADEADSKNPVDLFQAMDAGQIDVRFIPANAEKANVLITNQTNQALHIELPEAIAAVPVLAQFEQGLGQNQNAGGGGATQGVGGAVGAGNGNQGFGNALGQGGGGNNLGRGGGQNGFGMGMMRIAPGKTRKLTARTVCLEHGKPEPNPRIAYRMIPIAEYTSDSRVAELCRQLGHGELRQKTAQAAAWHLASGMTWEKLGEINRVESRYVGNIKYFRADDLSRAKKWVANLEESKSETNADRYALSRSQ